MKLGAFTRSRCKSDCPARLRRRSRSRRFCARRHRDRRRDERPVRVGDVVSVYANIARVGRMSITVSSRGIEEKAAKGIGRSRIEQRGRPTLVIHTTRLNVAKIVAHLNA